MESYVLWVFDASGHIMTTNLSTNRCTASLFRPVVSLPSFGRKRKSRYLEKTHNYPKTSFLLVGTQTDHQMTSSLLRNLPRLSRKDRCRAGRWSEGEGGQYVVLSGLTGKPGKCLTNPMCALKPLEANNCRCVSVTLPPEPFLHSWWWHHTKSTV